MNKRQYKKYLKKFGLTISIVKSLGIPLSFLKKVTSTNNYIPLHETPYILELTKACKRSEKIMTEKLGIPIKISKLAGDTYIKKFLQNIEEST